MIDSSFYFKGKLAKTFGIELCGPIRISQPKPRVTVIDVPGRNGTYSIFDGSYENRTITVECYLLDYGMPGAVSRINEWLIGETESFEFRDTNDEQHFYKARCTSGVPLNTRAGVLGSFELTFDAAPQRFLNFGNKAVEPQQYILKNPTAYPSRPLITFRGSGEVRCMIRDAAVYINFPVGVPVINYDAELDRAYNGGRGMDEYCYADRIVELLPGGNLVTYTGGGVLDSITFIPRWWEL